MHPSSLRAFQRHQEHDLKHLVLVDFIITKKKKKLPSFIETLNLKFFFNHVLKQNHQKEKIRQK
jgi:hypothetical protein